MISTKLHYLLKPLPSSPRPQSFLLATQNTDAGPHVELHSPNPIDKQGH
jgi:hypothetical protein